LFLQVVVTVTALTVIAPILGLVVLIGVVIFLSLCFLTNKILGPRMSKFQEMRNDIDKKHSEFLRSASLIKLNAKEKEIEQEYTEQLTHANKEIKGVWLKYIHHLAIRITIIDITRTAVMVLGIYMVYQGAYTPGFLVVFLSWSTNAFNRLWTAGYLQRNIIEDWSAIKNLFGLLNSDVAIKEIENPIVLKEIKGDIEYKNVSFKYPSREVAVSKKLKLPADAEDHTLKNVGISIKAGERVAIVGHSGAGKSSLVQLLIRAYDPVKGKILIDGCDLKDLSLENYRSRLGVVPQDVSLFDESLRYNILFGAKEKVSDRQLNQAIKMARVESFLKGLENGLDTLIGEKGVKLSGGERQRVGIARALVKNPAILIFDEATSSLDVENEALIRESIEEASKGRTTIIIAHRLSTIKDADKIIVLEKGRVIAEGKHTELLKSCEPYKKMINIQTVMVGDE
jgi:ABC-type multidrug transport system fused ATPase/permease subunit